MSNRLTVFCLSCFFGQDAFTPRQQGTPTNILQNTMGDSEGYPGVLSPHERKPVAAKDCTYSCCWHDVMRPAEGCPCLGPMKNSVGMVGQAEAGHYSRDNFLWLLQTTDGFSSFSWATYPRLVEPLFPLHHVASTVSVFVRDLSYPVLPLLPALCFSEAVHCYYGSSAGHFIGFTDILKPVFRA